MNKPITAIPKYDAYKDSGVHPLLQQILQGESKTLEFKLALPAGDQVAKTVIAFANTAGGKLVIGVNDQRELVGLGDTDVFKLMDKISSILHNHCQPTLLPEIYVENVNGYELLLIDVSRGALLPYYLENDGKDSGCYIRLGATNRQAGPEQIVELERQRLNICFDEQICYDVSLESLNLDSIRERFEKDGKRLGEEQMRNLKLIKEDQGTLYPTQGLLILLGYYEHVEIKCSRFKGTTMTVFLDKKEYSGDLFSQLEQAELFIKNHLQLKVEINGLQHTENYELPMSAIREALLNAFIHRDYSNFGRDIKLGIYDDVLNIVSPGGLPHGLTQDDLVKGRSEIRNRTLARVFKTLGFIEQWGSGIQRIYEQCSEYGARKPKLTESGDFIDWEFFRSEAKAAGGTIDKSGGTIGGAIDKSGGSIGGPIDKSGGPIGGPIDKSGGPINKSGGPIGGQIDKAGGQIEFTERQEEILELIKKDNSISLRAIAKFLKINDSAVKKHLNNLKAKGVLKRVGGTRGHWEVNA